MSPNARWHVQDGGIYHLVTRGNNRKQVFHEREDYDFYLALLRKYKKQCPVLIYHYCLMPNHVHLLIRIVHGKDLKKMMQGISQSYSNYYKKRYSHSGHLWQGRYKSFLIESDGYLLDCGRYIERNPLRAGMVTVPGDWAYASYGHYGLGHADALVDEHGLYLDLGRDAPSRRAAYQVYVMQERPYEQLVDKQFQIH